MAEVGASSSSTEDIDYVQYLFGEDQTWEQIKKNLDIPFDKSNLDASKEQMQELILASLTDFEVARVFLVLGDNKVAENKYKAAINEAEQGSDIWNKSVNGLGVVFSETGELDKAQEYFELVLVSAEEGSDTWNKSAHHLGTLFWKRGDLNKAQEYFESVLASAEEGSHVWNESRNYLKKI